MNNVVIRSSVLLVVSTVIVLVSTFVAPPASAPRAMAAGMESGDMVGHDMSSMSLTVDSEAAFITGMIPHHREAVESARTVLETTERPEVRDLAQDVIATQTEEIATLEGWREQWYPDAAEADYTLMMDDLAGVSPDEADRTFLQGMVEHHQGAIAMAQSYLDADFEKHAEVARMAEAIVSVQDGEIKQMQAWLGEWYGESGSDHNAH